MDSSQARWPLDQWHSQLLHNSGEKILSQNNDHSREFIRARYFILNTKIQILIKKFVVERVLTAMSVKEYKMLFRLVLMEPEYFHCKTYDYFTLLISQHVFVTYNQLGQFSLIDWCPLCNTTAPPVMLWCISAL